MTVPGYRIIHVEFIYPAIPDRSFDYQATFADYEPGCPIGHGETEQEAIDDLHEQLEDELEFKAWLATPDGQKYLAERRA